MSRLYVEALAPGSEYVPRPREATSVAIRIGERPALNSPRTQSRSRLVDMKSAHIQRAG